MTTSSPATPKHLPSLDSFLSQPLAVGEPDVSGPLAVFPIFGPEPKLEYVSFAQGFEQGVTIKELEGDASVNDLLVGNGGELPVLLYEGEEVLGAQQNRTFDVTVLVAAGAKLKMPVSCVEAGRWDGSRHDEQFEPAPQMTYPELRRIKNQQARQAVAVGAEARASQTDVWHEIGAKSGRLGVNSQTSAMHDVFEARRDKLSRISNGVALRDGQVGALAAIGGEIKVLDLASRPDVFAQLHSRLVQGYALDAIEADEAPAPTLGDAQGFVALASGVRTQQRLSLGVGSDLWFSEDGVAGSGLVHEGELVQLTAFLDQPPKISDSVA